MITTLRTPPARLSRSPLRRTLPGVAALVSALALLGGCTVEDELDAEPDESIPLEIERNGQVFEWLSPLIEQEVEPGPDAIARPLDALTSEPVELEALEALLDPRPLSTWPREELAEALRPVIATADGIYVAQEPAWDAADAILEGRAEPFSVDVRERVGQGRPAVEPVEDTAFRNIIGTDGRSRVLNTQVSPFNAVAKIHLYTGNTYRGSCSGAYIGPWTFITAGHCLVFSNTDRINRIRFEPARNGATLPYGSHDCRLDDASSSNDYLWSVPDGYYTGQALELDYAVIDTYPCHAAPNWFNSYQVNSGNTSYSLYGYPGDTCPGAPGPGNYQCGMTGSAYINSWRIESEHIDGTDGQSGGPWYGLFDGSLKPAGVHVGYIEYYDFFRCGFDPCRRNFATHIDTAFSDFIIDVAWDF